MSKYRIVFRRYSTYRSESIGYCVERKLWRWWIFCGGFNNLKAAETHLSAITLKPEVIKEVTV